ncbi:Strictosidine synthase 1 [Acorus gramineus]|uniref:Strictosidine synthase 1 n=1 Tax=Acorus gramineus TaxID=55184 RepID=A0AAV9AV44_ACOGR|nr:Strictosidine synthase 1 [Acorus gramineus]
MANQTPQPPNKQLLSCICFYIYTHTCTCLHAFLYILPTKKKKIIMEVKLTLFLTLTLLSMQVVVGTPLVSNVVLSNHDQLDLTPAVGPESLTFDGSGGGPYVGVWDGRVLKWDGHRRRWVEFAITTPHRREKQCHGTDYVKQESFCGRPLGLQFYHATGELYIVDPYFGLMKVGPQGGLAEQLATAADGQPFFLLNNLDVDQATGVVYFTDSSNQFRRRDWVWSILTREATGRLMKYDPSTRRVTVLLNHLAFPNGVALSQDSSSVLVVESTTSRILRYWLHGPKNGTSDVFATVPDYPDNLKMNSDGEFWVAINTGKGKVEGIGLMRAGDGAGGGEDTVAARIDGEGRVVEVLREVGAAGAVSEVDEVNGTLWFGSLTRPFVGFYSRP